MDVSKLASCTTGQRLVIETFDEPLMVAAGAGSGKTFTLTQRTVNAFSPASGAPPVVQTLDEVLVITFTKKAAAELRDRIRRRLDEEGFTDVASRVDTAWVSTIHGMASRILRENALELGIDPAFEVISEDQANELHEQAINEVIAEVTSEDTLLAELFRTDSLTASSGASFGKSSAREQAEAILNRVEALPASFDGLVIEPPTSSPFQFLTALLETAQDYYDLFDSWTAPQFGKNGKPKKIKELGQKEEEAKAQFEQAISLAETWLASHNDIAFTDEGFDADAYFEVFFAFPKLTASFGKGRDAQDFTEAYRGTYAALAVEVLTQAGYKRLLSVVELANRVNERFKELKGVSRMDNTDLLRRTYEALRDHEAIARKYQDQFKLIMVDEFQDTDKLQVALIKLLAQPDLSNVCTVGDAQQSIYRFRGADVEVFKDYRDALPTYSAQAKTVELGDNFRSHGDVLAIVDTIFRQQNAFGGEFLHLEPKGKVNTADNPIFSSSAENATPRIRFDIIQHKGKRGEVGVNGNEVVILSARRIAAHFADLAQRGVSFGSMALLLGKMTNADIYAQALREVGIESVIAGGSVFCSSAEALLVNNLLHVALARQDEEALFAVLISPLFSLSDDTLLVLSRGSGAKGASLSKGFFAADSGAVEAGEQVSLAADDGADEVPGDVADVAVADVAGEDFVGEVSPVVSQDSVVAHLCQQLSPEDAQRWQRSRDLLRAFITEARTGSPTEALRTLFVQSGYFYRLESQGAEGIAAAGNIAKALHLVRGFEDNASGIASLALAYERHLATAKEAPGSLSTEDTGCLKIMTVHASKGLEFGHVALADMKDGCEIRSSLVVENVGDCTYASLSSGYQPAYYTVSELRKYYDELQAEDICDGLRPDQTPGLRHEVLLGLKKQHELEEAQRLLYVALTRAVESLYVSCVSEGDPSSKTFSYKGIMDSIATALNWDTAGKASREFIDYGGSAPALVDYTFLTNSQDLDEALQPYEVEAVCKDTSFEVPIWAPVKRPALHPASSLRADMTSYTALSEGLHEGLEGEELDGEVFDGRVPEGVRFGGIGHASEALAMQERAIEEANAPDFGSAFHELAQRAILLARAQGIHKLALPTRTELEQKLARFDLVGQVNRLEAALHRWVTSDVAHDLIGCREVDAEVPFMVPFTNADGQVRYLEGSIDALGVKESGEALLVDYKTGGLPDETPEALQKKHELQAKCYSYALLDAGYPSIDARFVRMEQHAESSDQPQVVRYRFAQDDKENLRREIHALMFA